MKKSLSAILLPASLILIVLFAAHINTAHAVNGPTITASPSSIGQGGSSYVSYSDPGAVCHQSPVFDPADQGQDTGNATVYPTTSTTYSVTCGGKTASVLVTVNAAPQPTATFSANPTTIVSGNSSTLSWSSTNASSCVISGGSYYSGQTVAASGSASVYPTTYTTYSIVCSGAGGNTSTVSAGVNVVPQTTSSLSANPSTITVGSNSALSWSSSNATSCTGTGFNTGGATSGTVSVAPSSSTQYSVTCSGSGGNQTSTAIVNVGQPTPLSAMCSPAYGSATVGQTVPWYASASGGAQPYTYNWSGDDMSGPGYVYNGTSNSEQTPTYNTSGTKSGSVSVVDSGASSGSPPSINWTGGYVCTGSKVGSDQIDTQDGGTASYSDSVAEYNGQNTYSDATDDSAAGWPADFQVNPQNYCVQGEVDESCNPSQSPSGVGGCPFHIHETLHTGTGVRPVTSSDLNQADYYQYFGTNVYTPGVGSSAQQRAGGACTATVSVAALTPTATISANPLSITSGQSSTITWSSTNTTACTISGIGTEPVSGSAAVSPTTTTTYNLSCTGQGGTATSAVTVTVSPPLAADLTASGLGNYTVTLGQPLTVSGTITNIGTGATSGGFTNLFVTNLDASQTYWHTLINSSSATLAAGASSVTSVTFPAGTFTAPGSYVYNLCANYNSSWANTVTESNYANNCAVGGTITVTAALPPTPTGLAAVCNANGTAVSLSWTPTPGATGYYPRMYAPTSAQCTSFGWQLYTDGLTCIPNPDVPQTYTSFSNFPITPGQNYTAWVHAYNSAGINPTPEYLNFSCSGLANLTATAGSAVSANAGQSTSFTGTVVNSGTGATSGGFWNLLQICGAGGNCTSYDNVSNEVWANTLGTGASAPVSISATVPSTAGTYSYRYCANNNTSWVNTVAESNYGDNCSSFQTLTVSSPTPSCTLSANPTSITPPTTTSTLTWTSTNTSSCVGSGFNTGNAANGSTSVTPGSGSTSYGLTCTGSSGGTCNATPVTVTNGCGGTATPTIKATPNVLPSGSTSVISYSATNVTTSCVLSGPGVAQTAPASSCNVGTQNATTPALTSTSKYCVVCDGGTPKCVTVAIQPKFKEF